MLTDGVPLIDHHCHGVVAGDLDRPGFESLLTEADSAQPDRSPFDSMLGTAVLRWCAPMLDLAPLPTVDRYLERRAELGWWEVSRRLLRGTGVEARLVDTGYGCAPTRAAGPVPCTDLDQLAVLGDSPAREIIRLESLAESVAAHGIDGSTFPVAVRDLVRERALTAVGLKSVIAYRTGLGIPGRAPSTVDVIDAARSWLRGGGGRLADPVLLAWLVHLGARIGAEFGLPLQLHTGFGDPDIRLHLADPSLLTDFLTATRDTGVTVMLLHCWPFQRAAGYLTQVFPHVLADVGLAVPHVGARAGTIIAELLELAPFSGVCFSTDGCGLPELHYLGALLWRHGLGRLVDRWLDEDVMSPVEAERLVSAFAFGNAERVYRRLSPGGNR